MRQETIRGLRLTGICILAQALLALPVQAARKEKPSDVEITMALEGDLEFDAAVPANEIDISTIDGIVTLTGTISNILAKERATTIAETVRGVRAVVNNISVDPVKRDDETIQTDIESALASDAATEAYEVDAEVKDGVATLTGTVDSWQERRLAAAVAMGVKGVREVNNTIDVSYKTDRSDSEIAADVEGALKNDVWVDAALIDTKVNEGKVILSGTVGSAAEKGRARADAWVAGVKSVDAGGLDVEPWARDKGERKGKVTAKSDDAIQEAVQDAFLYDPRVYSFNPTVTVSDRVVTLTGTVDNLKAKRAAERDEKNTTGVWRVKNYLKVRTKTTPPDETLSQTVEDALRRDPYVERYEIDVNATDGTVYLGGVVDTYFERTQAEDVASGVRGVSEVKNNLTVSFPAYTHYTWPYTDYYHTSYYYDRPLDSLAWNGASDSEIKEEINDELFWSPFVDSDEVSVSVSDGQAKLSGKVDSWSEYNAAVENAWEGGARNVVNNLEIQ